MSMKTKNLDPTVIRIMKLRKRHVRLALEKAEEARKKISIQPCPKCGQDAEAHFEGTVYRGHYCPSGHGFIVPRRLRDPNAPRAVIEKADVQHMPLRPSAPVTPQDVQRSLAKQKELQGTFERIKGTQGWKEQEWKQRRI